MSNQSTSSEHAVPRNGEGSHRDLGVVAREGAESLESWEGEGGSTGRLASDVVRVLIVDNDMAAADALELLVHASGSAETKVAYTARAALAIAQDYRPAIALIELDLRDMGSYQLGQLLRERAQLEKLRLIAVTDSRAHAGRDLARDAGFERYLLKPVEAADLFALFRT